MARIAVPLIALLLWLPFTATAQDSPPTVDFFAGKAAVIDELPIGHSVVGGAVRWSVTPRLSLGPEVAYMRGPGFDWDLFATGNLTFEFQAPPARLVPYVVAGGGIMWHSDRFGTSTYGSTEGAFTAGGGVRIALSDRWSAGVETRIGWEPHLRINGVVSARLGK
jgi:hypothetical protein